ncbi:MAG: protein kinase [Phormidesmis sp.]
MASSSSAAAVIERLGDRYEILHSIGRPCGYQQLLANDTQRRRWVVIKSLAIEEQTPPGDICCFEREIHLLESLKHPTIPRYIESFSVDAAHTGSSRKGLVLVQSHNGGQTLAQRVAAGQTFSEADIKEIAKQLLQGLIYLHSKGLIHRDLTPDSIVITGSETAEVGQVCWLSLGTVQYVQTQPKDTLVGTYGYMPPEQVGGQAAFASDLYSLGATLIYLATGCHLGELPHRPNQGSLKAKFACPTTRMSLSLQQWINWLIEPAVSDRPATAKKALAALNHLPLAMLKQRLWKPTKAQLLPVPIRAQQGQEEPYFTQIKQLRQRRSLELVVPPTGLKSTRYRRALPPLVMGITLMSVALYLISLLTFSPGMFSSFEGVASLAAAALGISGGLYSLRFLKAALGLLSTCFLRQVHLELKSDVLLIAYKYWLRSPVYVVNTRREDIYNISALADCGALRILTHRNRTRIPCDCYQLTLSDGALSPRDIRWLASLLNEWRSQAGRCPRR